jgi:hypothetical protein
MHHEFPDWWEGKDSVSENSDDNSWSVVVNLDNDDLVSKSGSSFESFVACVVAKLDTGQKLRFCVNSSVFILRTLCGFCRDVIRLMFGNKEGFSC